MDDDDPQAVKRLLLYLYTLDYPEEDDSDVPVTMDRSHPPRLFSAATEGESILGTMSDSLDGATLSDPRMMNNVLVYAVAEKYDIPDLKDLAKSKFLTLATSKWPHVDLYAVLETIFSATPDGDMGLRQIILDICRQHVQDILKDDEARAAFLDIQAIKTVVLDTAVRNNEQDKILLDLALAKQIALEDQLSKAEAETERVLNENIQTTGVLKVELAKAKAEAQTAMNQEHDLLVLNIELEKAKAETQTTMNQKHDLFLRLNGLVDNINWWEDCRNCAFDFGFWIERLGSENDPQFKLRCTRCRCRHDLGGLHAPMASAGAR